MNRFKSGIITKNGVTLTPVGKEDCESLLREMRLKDTNLRRLNEYRRYPVYSLADGCVFASLIPPMNIATDTAEWKYQISQGTIPEWYSKDSDRYEQMFRDAVKKYVAQNYVILCGHAWQPIVKGRTAIKYLYAGSLGNMEFGPGNNYATSEVRKFLLTSKLLSDLRGEFGHRLLSLSVDLGSYDWYWDYGIVQGEQMTLLTDNEYVAIENKIDGVDAFWLATPESTPSRGGAGTVLCGGKYCCRWQKCYSSLAVRPCIMLKG